MAKSYSRKTSISAGLKLNIQYVTNNISLVVTYDYVINDYTEYVTADENDFDKIT